MYAEITSGLREDPTQVLEAVFEADHDEMIMVGHLHVQPCFRQQTVNAVGARSMRVGGSGMNCGRGKRRVQPTR